MEQAMNFETAFFLLLGIMIVREIIFMINTHRLINKLMSRNLHEYRIAENLVERDNNPKRQEVINEAQAQQDGLAEDLGALTGIV